MLSKLLLSVKRPVTSSFRDDCLKYRFVPLEDITAYELAYIMAHVCNITTPMWTEIRISTEAYPNIPDNVKRHFVPKD